VRVGCLEHLDDLVVVAAHLAVAQEFTRSTWISFAPGWAWSSATASVTNSSSGIANSLFSWPGS
jgi:hypothetical protein